MPKAGLFFGEVTQAAPADGAITTRPKGAHWMEYGNIFEPESLSYVDGFGYASTQNNYWAGVDFAHPFSGDSYNEFTIMGVFQATSIPSTTQDRGLFSLYMAGNKTKIFMRARSGPQIFIGFNMMVYDGVTDKSISEDRVEVTLDHPSWSWGDWYCVVMSHSYTVGKTTASVTNLTRGEEELVNCFVNNNLPVRWKSSTSGDVRSQITYGYDTPYVSHGGPQGSPNFPQWLGNISQTLVHNGYVDLTVAGAARTFCGIDGVIPLGVNGESPFGTQPLVYMPAGHPSNNLGTKFLGTWDSDFFWKDSLVAGTSTPPEAT